MIAAVVVLVTDAFSTFITGTTGAGVLSLFLLHDSDAKTKRTINKGLFGIKEKFKV